MSLSAKEKQEYAWLLFKDGAYSRSMIADKVGVSEKTITEWKQKYNWDAKKKSLFLTREEILVDLYDIFDNTKTAIKKKGGIADSKDGDALLKLSATIKNLETETSVATIYEVAKGLIEHIQKIDFEKAKELIDYVDSFLKEKLKRG